MKKAIIFDIDGTLTTKSSWSFITEYLGASWENHSRLYQETMAGRMNHSDATRELCNMWVATGRASREIFKEAFYKIPLREGAEEALKLLKYKYHLCMITGSVDLFAEVMSKRVGIRDYYCNTTLEWLKNGDLTKIHYDENQEEKKIEQLKNFCSKNNIEPNECVPVGDSWNDVMLFDYTGNGIFIESEFEDKRLQKHAWKSIEKLSELTPELIT